MRFLVSCDNVLHQKLRIISAYKKQSLNSIMVELFEKLVSSWEKKNGEIKISDKD